MTTQNQTSLNKADVNGSLANTRLQRAAHPSKKRHIRFTDPSSLRATIKSLTGDAEKYDVVFDEHTGELTCTCADARFRKVVCKHQVRFAKAFIRKHGRGGN